MKKYLALTAMAALLAGCVQEDGLFLQGQDTSVSITSVEVNDLQSTRADRTPLTTGSLGLFVNGTNLDSKYTADNMEWRYVESESSWSPCWTDDYSELLFDGAGRQKAYAYHPYAINAYKDGFTTNGATDLLWWNSETTLSEPAFAVNFDHALSKLTINLKKESGMTSDIIGVTVEGTILTAKPDIAAQTWAIAPDAATASLTASFVKAKTGMDATFTVLLIPQCTSALKITVFTSDNRTFVYKHDSMQEFTQGTAYSLDLQIKTDNVNVTAISAINVNSWGTEVVMPNGVAGPSSQVIIDAKEMSWEELTAAVTNALSIGNTNIVVTLDEACEINNELLCALGLAIDDVENVPDGSITLTIEGTKSTYDFIGHNPSTSEPRTKLASVILPDVLDISAGEFSGCKKLTYVYAPKLQSLGYCSFAESGITTFTIPAGVTSIDDRVFYDCDQLQTVTILANQVVSLGEEVFEQSENLTSIFVPADLVDDYKATADWRDYALKIKAIGN